jgi:H+-transporting ATPase
LKKSLKPLATVKRDGNWVNIDASLVVPGDLALLAAGKKILSVLRVENTLKA